MRACKAALAGGLLSLLALGCSDPEEPRRPNLVLISLDTLRHDRWCDEEGAGCEVMRGLSEATSRGTYFGRATTASAFTLPSHMTVMTGLYPDVHRVRKRRERLAPEIPTVAELLHGAGYRTEGIYSNMWLNPEFGFGRGFDDYRASEFELTFAHRVSAMARESLDRLTEDPGRPFFLFVHYLDAHSDFESQTASRLPYYSPERYRGNLGFDSMTDRFCSSSGACATEFLLELNRRGETLDPDRSEQLRALYDGGAAYLADELGELFRDLESRGLLETTWIVVFSDHGEELGDHGHYLHDRLYEECVAVPIWIREPGARPRAKRVDDPVETIDIATTLLAAAGVPPPDHHQGRSLLEAGTPSATRRQQFSVDRFADRTFAIRAGEWKLIHDFETRESRLFDLSKDPGETNDLSALEPERVESLVRQLDRRVRHHEALAEQLRAGLTPGEDLSEDDLKRLRSVGYL